MFNLRNIAGMVLGLTLAVAGGCQSGSSGMAKSAPMSKAVVVTAGQGSYVVYVPDDKGGVAKMASSDVKMGCADCEKDAAKYFTSGQISKSCPVCGATRTTVGTN